MTVARVVVAAIMIATTCSVTPLCANEDTMQAKDIKTSADIDGFFASLSKRDYRNLLGLTKAQLLKKLAPKHKGRWLSDWCPSRDLTTFTSSGTDTAITLQFVYVNGKVAKLREILYRGYEYGTKDELSYGNWLVADSSSSKRYKSTEKH